MARSPNPKRKKTTNTSGVNQHRSEKLLDAVPEMASLLQQCFDEGVRQKDIPAWLEKRFPGLGISARSVRRLIQKLEIRTPRHGRMTPVEKGMAILRLQEDDPLNRWGGRTVQEKLARESVHVTRDFVMNFRQHENSEASSSRNPHTRKAHCHGLSSAGPNEEWGIDGHEKVTALMGISVYGCIDKYSRMELGLWACPNARDQNLPLALWLRVVKERGGMSTTLTCDMGTELGKIISVATELRAKHLPELDEASIPTVTAVKSTKNITRERAWRPLWEKELSNVAHEYKIGKLDAGYHPNNDFHQGLSRWLWAQIVQLRLDKHRVENSLHRPRAQKILLPTNARRIDMYENPEAHGGTDLLIPIPSSDVDRLLAQHDDPHLTQFGTDAEVALYQDLFAEIGSPELSAKHGWDIFSKMVDAYCSRLEVEEDGR